MGDVLPQNSLLWLFQKTWWKPKKERAHPLLQFSASTTEQLMKLGQGKVCGCFSALSTQQPVAPGQVDDVKHMFKRLKTPVFVWEKIEYSWFVFSF